MKWNFQTILLIDRQENYNLLNKTGLSFGHFNENSRRKKLKLKSKKLKTQEKKTKTQGFFQNSENT